MEKSEQELLDKQVKLMTQMIEISTTGGRLLDGWETPFHIGASLARHFRLDYYAIRKDEISDAIPQETKEYLRGSLKRLSSASPCFSMILINDRFLRSIPYYNSSNERLKIIYRTMVAAARLMVPGGLMAFPISKNYLSSDFIGMIRLFFKKLRIYSLDDQSALIVAHRNETAPRESFYEWNSLDISPWRYEFAARKKSYALPAVFPETALIRFIEFSKENAEIEAKRAGLWSNEAFVKTVVGHWKEQSVRPQMPLRSAHLQLLVAGGLLNNRPFMNNGKRYLIKASIIRKKSEAPDPGTDEKKVIETHCPVSKVQLLELDSGMFYDIVSDEEVIQN